jgi:hypothetical protein
VLRFVTWCTFRTSPNVLSSPSCVSLLRVYDDLRVSGDWDLCGVRTHRLDDSRFLISYGVRTHEIRHLSPSWSTNFWGCGSGRIDCFSHFRTLRLTALIIFVSLPSILSRRIYTHAYSTPLLRENQIKKFRVKRLFCNRLGYALANKIYSPRTNAFLKITVWNHHEYWPRFRTRSHRQ